MALVTCDGNGAEESLSARAFDVPLSGRPSVTALATWLREMVEAHDVRCLCIDGPLGWRSPHTDSPHCRLSERAVRAPGRLVYGTGWPGPPLLVGGDWTAGGGAWVGPWPWPKAEPDTPALGDDGRCGG